MIYRNPRPDERLLYERLAQHPMQSWAWGEFREKTGINVNRLVGFDGSEAVAQLQTTFHKVPKLPYTVGYFPRGVWPDEVQLAALRDLGERENAVFIKIEPDVSAPPKSKTDLQGLHDFLINNGCAEGRPFFSTYSFLIDLKQSEEDLLARMKSKTRYNIKVAEKHGVEVVEDDSDDAFAWYLELMKETTSRQQFYAHTESYHKKMWAAMKKAGTAKLMLAVHKDKVLTAWILFQYKKRLYYPYGASSRSNREMMASNLVMWRAMQMGKRLGCTSFDLWGSLGPKPNPKDPWFGFHNFKAGYGGDLAEFVGSYDLVLQPQLYKLYRMADIWRWRYLKLRSALPF
jgi:lipid II:glycine glycyltransferase (peptidoglycan interpeptide bridge formation enzyme)